MTTREKFGMAWFGVLLAGIFVVPLLTDKWWGDVLWFVAWFVIGYIIEGRLWQREWRQMTRWRDDA